jgi:hypothetical protein
MTTSNEPQDHQRDDHLGDPGPIDLAAIAAEMLDDDQPAPPPADDAAAAPDGRSVGGQGTDERDERDDEREPVQIRLDVLHGLARSAAEVSVTRFLEEDARQALVEVLTPGVEAQIGEVTRHAVTEILTAGGRTPHPPHYPDVGAWVEGFLIPHYRRPMTADRRWCPRWFVHTEALTRLRALWTAWEEARYGGATAMAAWWLHYFDPMMAALTHAQGPFHACARAHVVPNALDTEEPPEGMFPAPARP